MPRLIQTVLVLLMVALAIAAGCAESFRWEPARWPWVMLCSWLAWWVAIGPTGTGRWGPKPK